MKLVTAAQMRAIDRETIDLHGISGPTLMESAGRGIAELMLSDLIDSPESTHVAVFCGKGNNGGDGFVIARYLHDAGVKVKTYFMGPADKLSHDARLNLNRAREADVRLTEVTSLNQLPADLEADFVVDALLGTGFTGIPEGLVAGLIEYINFQNGLVVAVDLPSGLNADTGAAEGAVVTAGCTYTLGLPKIGLYISPGREIAGDVRIIDIGLPENVIAQQDLNTTLITAELVAELLPYRKPDGHKGDFGRLLLVAGSTGLTGAASLASLAAARSGCGLIKIAAPATAQPILAVKLTEVMTIPLPEVSRKGVLALRALGEIRKYVEQHDAIVIGPGLGTHHETRELMQRLIPYLNRPAIVDADGLNAFEGAADLLKQRSGAYDLVLTPHPGEYARLTGAEISDGFDERIQSVLQTAREFAAVVVLKGSPTLVAEPQGACYLNPTGNSGMATGGSGDVLSGMIGSFLAQGMSPLDAALCGVYLHGRAGDLAADELTERAMIAGDIITYLPQAFEEIELLTD
ncbi:bifunctional ADP-dependent NAD(P)H-hydrate dehydratase/NAD(P)H-hydrate epimerase [candidate division GN15 bacterium]|uniref:Bifunctional NAD(P)H-hydrate repair enzyme n=1 Tax=candidate division GN15 bacterium TaxID=2072418 RepID=A0A855X9L6_9BACT|nr:MAG: bifunctional ADP-dependent NAD(P)H-hydrate dehydratase/NAD(P)H-hydrate epimerase [candidate division GN15 bacterium]